MDVLFRVAKLYVLFYSGWQAVCDVLFRLGKLYVMFCSG